MCDKMAISAYILKIVEKDPFLRLQMRAKEMFNRHQFFSKNKAWFPLSQLRPRQRPISSENKAISVKADCSTL